MKVPYLAKKRAADMLSLAGEFSEVIGSHLEVVEIERRIHSPWLKSIYPLFALLQILERSNARMNPSREYALAGASAMGDARLFLQSVSAFGEAPDVLLAMQRAYGGTVFTGFISELKSDLLMVLFQGLVYSYRGAGVGLRCAVEDLYRHLYYMDHLQEFHALQDGVSEYSMKLSPQGFRDYLRRASYFSSFSRVNTKFSVKLDGEMDWFGMNDSLYGDLSAAVHGASGEWFASISSASSLRRDEVKEDRLNILIENFTKFSISFLIAAHRDAFSSGGEYDKSIVLEVFDLEERGAFRKLMNV